jgi:NAD(P)-dependent dehydrogenase (short-subunit alcohol dehydrogenase family)
MYDPVRLGAPCMVSRSEICILTGQPRLAVPCGATDRSSLHLCLFFPKGLKGFSFLCTGPFAACSCVCKGANVTFKSGLAQEQAKNGIRVNVVAPGIT